MNKLKTLLIITLATLTSLFTVSCSQETADELIVYSGRSQALVDNLVDQFKKQTGANIKVRYGNDAELLAILNEEGDRSPADIFWANTTGALANANENDLLSQLPDSLLQIPASYTASTGRWLPVTVRFRVLGYNPNNISAEELPASVMELPNMQQFEGRVGWTPTYSSFYDFITAMRLEEGRDATLNWLEGMQNLNPKSYPSNTPMVQAIAAGEIDMGLTNHYYILRVKDGEGAESNIETHHFDSGDIGNLALVTGAGVLNTSDNTDLAHRFLRFLLSEQAQRYAAESVHEYPVIRDVEVTDIMLGEGEAFELSPDYDYEELRELEQTLDLLREAGLN
ncbi:MAG: iron ABC transporter substrate-binding protein [Candidatus Halalkalibacterium sp. M3_1C_030]